MEDLDKSQIIGAVAIGRNEGPRLRACLASLVRDVANVVYVDSGSTDNSVAIAEALGVDVVKLDMSIPFTAARARNTGSDHLMQMMMSNPPFAIQFVDGDCEVVEGWIERATACLENDDAIASVCGRRRERFPENSVFNRLCDIEWNTSIGEAKSTGGDFLIRTNAFLSVDGFNAGLIAGEEPDLCFRLRETKWKIWRLDAEMTLHDANMTHLRQWWQRAKRAGYAYANGFALHGRKPEAFRQREVMRSVIFGGVFPFVTLVAAMLINPWFLIMFAYYPAQIAKVYLSRSDISPGRAAFAISCALSRVPEFLGILKFFVARIRGRQSALIEYK